MLKYKKGDMVLLNDEFGHFFAKIDDSFSGNKTGVWLLEAMNSDAAESFDFMFETDDTEYDLIDNDILQNKTGRIEPIKMTSADAGRYLKLKVDLEELYGDVMLPFSISSKCRLDITPRMLLNAIRYFIDSMDRNCVYNFLEYIYVVKTVGKFGDEEKILPEGITEKAEEILCLEDSDIVRFVVNNVSKKPSAVTVEDMFKFEDFLDCHIKSSRYETELKYFPDFIMEKYIDVFSEKAAMMSATDREIGLYRLFTDELSERGNPVALRKKAIGCFGNGNRAYEQDWVACEECFKRLYDMDGDPFTANFLGNLAFYGRVTGKPDYKKAYKYFTIGAFAGFYESNYTMGDMFAYGLGVKKQPYIANKLWTEVYNSTFDDFRQKRFDYEFADAAYRLGRGAEEGIGTEKDMRLAYLYYLQADLAIRKRIECAEWYHDKKLSEEITERLGNVESMLGDKVSHTRDTFSMNFPWLCGQMTAGGRRVEVLYHKIGKDMIKFTMALLEHDGTRAYTANLITVPELAYCDLLDEVNLYCDRPEKFWCMNTGRFVYNHIVFNADYNRHEFYLYDELVAYVKARKYTFRVDRARKAEPTIRFAAVSFEEGGNTYNYICEDDKIHEGDKVIVITSEGEKEVTVESIFVIRQSELIRPLEQYKEIVRKVQD
ncbi:MAG: hypothetical protein Q4C42_02335 [Clostridia bacterium]|nr:hypothetical protein [Clostridia bacterium]